MRPLVIIGATQLAELSHDYFGRDGRHRVAAFAVDAAYRKTDSLQGLPVVDLETLPDTHPPEQYAAFVAIGYQRMNAGRREKCEAARALGYELASYVHPSSHVAPSARLGDNTLILENNVIQPHATLGDGVIVNFGNAIGHHSRIGDYVFFSSLGLIGGGASVGAGSFIGATTFVREGIELGIECMVGSQAMVLKSAPDRSVFAVPGTEPRSITSDRLRRI